MDVNTARVTRFENVAAQVYEPLQRYLRRRSAPEDADEVLNDTLTVIWRRLDDVPIDEPLPWCYAVARRSLANHRRGDRRRARLVGRLVEARSATVHVDEPQLGDDDQLTRSLRSLGPDDRELVRLWAWEQLEPREIAVVLDTTANAVSLRLARAKRRLRAALGQNGGPAGQEPVGHRKEHRS